MIAETLERAANAIRADHSPWHDDNEQCDEPRCEMVRYHHAVAAWLDKCAPYAAWTSRLHPDRVDQDQYVQGALAVARAYLGTQHD